MPLDILRDLGLATNEARIYETLLAEGESSVGQIAKKSQVNRRNIYDSLKRLQEKGLVFEILQKNENHYQAIDPRKLTEILEEKQQALSLVMPTLTKLYESTSHKEEAYVYRGLEGYKNEMRDILRIGQNAYTIGGKSLWSDKRLEPFIKQFAKEVREKEIQIYILLDHEVGDRHQAISQLLKRK